MDTIYLRAGDDIIRISVEEPPDPTSPPKPPIRISVYPGPAEPPDPTTPPGSPIRVDIVDPALIAEAEVHDLAQGEFILTIERTDG